MKTIRDFLFEDLTADVFVVNPRSGWKANIDSNVDHAILRELKDRGITVDQPMTDEINDLLIKIIQEMIDNDAVLDLVDVPIALSDILDVWLDNSEDIDEWYHIDFGTDLVGSGLKDTISIAVEGWLRQQVLIYAYDLIDVLEYSKQEEPLN